MEPHTLTDLPREREAAPPRVLILGAHGRLGAAAAHAFHAAGWQVLAQVRRAVVPGLPTDATVLNLALGDTAALARAAQGATVVVHAINPVYTQWHTQALPTLQQGMAVAQVLGAHFMLPGNVYNFGEGMPALLDDATPQQPSTRKGAIRVAMESALRHCAERDGLRATVLRAGDFFGAGQGSWLDLVIAKSVGAGKLVYPGPLDVPHAWAYLPDLARAFVAVAQPAATAGLRELMFPGYTLTGEQLLSALERAARSLGIQSAKPIQRGHFPWALIRAGGLVCPLWRELAEMSYLWRVPHALDGRRWSAMAGSLSTTPVEEALRAALLAMGVAPTHALSIGP